MKILTFFLIVIIGLLIYLISEYKKEKKPFGDRLPWKKLLPEYIGKACEITVKDPLVNIDIMFSVTGILRDVDDEWHDYAGKLFGCIEKLDKFAG